MDLETSADVAILRLAAGKANAMSQEFLARLNQLLDRLAASPARAAVMIGTGKSFSAGLDLPSLIALSREAMRAFIVEFEATMLRVFRLERPLVAAVNGHAIAGGCVLALQADARIAAAGGAKIGLNETSLGIGLPAVVLETLRCQVPPASLVPIALEGRLFGVDGNPPSSAAWVAQHATPSAAYRGLIHQQDTGNNRFARSVNNWQTLQMPASQQHVSTAPCTGTCSPHNSVAQDEATYGDRWRALLGTP